MTASSTDLHIDRGVQTLLYSPIDASPVWSPRLDQKIQRSTRSVTDNVSVRVKWSGNHLTHLAGNNIQVCFWQRERPALPAILIRREVILITNILQCFVATWFLHSSSRLNRNHKLILHLLPSISTFTIHPLPSSTTTSTIANTNTRHENTSTCLGQPKRFVTKCSTFKTSSKSSWSVPGHGKAD